MEINNLCIQQPIEDKPETKEDPLIRLNIYKFNEVEDIENSFQLESSNLNLYHYKSDTETFIKNYQVNFKNFDFNKNFVCSKIIKDKTFDKISDIEFLKGKKIVYFFINPIQKYFHDDDDDSNCGAMVESHPVKEIKDEDATKTKAKQEIYLNNIIKWYNNKIKFKIVQFSNKYFSLYDFIHMKLDDNILNILLKKFCGQNYDNLLFPSKIITPNINLKKYFDDNKFNYHNLDLLVDKTITIFNDGKNLISDSVKTYYYFKPILELYEFLNNLSIQNEKLNNFIKSLPENIKFPESRFRYQERKLYLFNKINFVPTSNENKEPNINTNNFNNNINKTKLLILTNWYDNKVKLTFCSQELSYDELLGIPINLATVNNSFMEKCHEYIQWLFPSKIKSQFNNDGPVLIDLKPEDDNEHKIINYNLIINNLPKSIDKYKKFIWLFVHNGYSDNDHNNKRISRILECLFFFKLEELAINFYIF